MRHRDNSDRGSDESSITNRISDRLDDVAEHSPISRKYMARKSPISRDDVAEKLPVSISGSGGLPISPLWIIAFVLVVGAFFATSPWWHLIVYRRNRASASGLAPEGEARSKSKLVYVTHVCNHVTVGHNNALGN